MNKEELKKKFKEYVNAFDMKDDGISRKYYHSLRVMNHAENLAKYNKFNDEDTEIAILVGLLHDYARFPQWTQYKTYSDLESIDHGDLGVELLFNNSEIKKFTNNVRYYDEIYDAIKYHNKYAFPNILSEHNKLLCDVIRDADKLDIFYLLSEEKILIPTNNEEITEVIKNKFLKKTALNYTDTKNINDKALLKIAMVFDLKFDYSFKNLYDNKYIDKIYESIENKEKFKKYFEIVNAYIKERID